MRSQVTTQPLTRAQRAVLDLIKHGAEVWEVCWDNDNGEYLVPPRYVLAVFDGDGFAGTLPVQIRTLRTLWQRGLIADPFDASAST